MHAPLNLHLTYAARASFPDQQLHLRPCIPTDASICMSALSALLTGAIYHMEHAPPPSNVPGLTERLVAPGVGTTAGAGADEAAAAQRALVGPRLDSAAVEGPELLAWLRRFGTLLRPVDGAAPMAEAAAAACDVAASVLRSKAAAGAAADTAALAVAARDGAERSHMWTAAAREHAEAAARELLAVKRAEASALALVTGSKTPDPAAAEVVKAQAAVKCSEQLKACCAAAAEAQGLAQRSGTSAEAAAEAARRCRLAVGDAVASAEAGAAAKRSGAWMWVKPHQGLLWCTLRGFSRFARCNPGIPYAFTPLALLCISEHS
jgi:hypothetical protein